MKSGRGVPSLSPESNPANMPKAPINRPVGAIDPPDPAMIVAEIAAVLRITKPHVHNLINGTVAGVPRLPAMRLGRRVVVRRSTFLRWQETVEGMAPGGTLGGSPKVDAGDASRSK